MVVQLEDTAEDLRLFRTSTDGCTIFKIGKHFDLLVVRQVLKVAVLDADERLGAPIVSRLVLIFNHRAIGLLVEADQLGGIII